MAWLRENGLCQDGNGEDGIDQSGIRGAGEGSSEQEQYYLTREGPSFDLRATLQMRFMNADERNERAGEHCVLEGEVVNERNESAVWRAVHQIATDRLKALRTRGDDEEAAGGGGGKARAKATSEAAAQIASHFRDNQSSLLRAVLRCADEHTLSEDEDELASDEESHKKARVASS